MSLTVNKLLINQISLCQEVFYYISKKLTLADFKPFLNPFGGFSETFSAILAIGKCYKTFFFVTGARK
jgi:hypothetical protein